MRTGVVLKVTFTHRRDGQRFAKMEGAGNCDCPTYRKRRKRLKRHRRDCVLFPLNNSYGRT